MILRLSVLLSLVALLGMSACPPASATAGWSRRKRRADDHAAASEPDSNGRPNSDVYGDGDGNRATLVSMAEGRLSHNERAEFAKLYDASAGDQRQRRDISSGR